MQQNSKRPLHNKIPSESRMLAPVTKVSATLRHSMLVMESVIDESSLRSCRYVGNSEGGKDIDLDSVRKGRSSSWLLRVTTPFAIG